MTSIYETGILYNNQYFKAYPIEGDGNCLFRSLAQFKYMTIGHTHLRQKLVDDMKSEVLRSTAIGKVLTEFYNQRDSGYRGTRTIHDHFAYMRREGTYGEDFEMLGFALIYGYTVKSIANLPYGLSAFDTNHALEHTLIAKELVHNPFDTVCHRFNRPFQSGSEKQLNHFLFLDPAVQPVHVQPYTGDTPFFSALETRNHPVEVDGSPPPNSTPWTVVRRGKRKTESVSTKTKDVEKKKKAEEKKADKTRKASLKRAKAEGAKVAKSQKQTLMSNWVLTTDRNAAASLATLGEEGRIVHQELYNETVVNVIEVVEPSPITASRQRKRKNKEMTWNQRATFVYIF
jgi:hypothetical protein